LSTIRKPYTTEFEIEPIKKSRFIAYALPIDSDEAALAFIEKIKMKTPDARHHCWAYALRQDLRVRFSDDGEPSGSAGQPMLRQLQGKDVFDLIVVVIRYSGGIKLGVGGLMRAYGGAVGQLLDRATVKTITPKLPLWLRYDYSDTTHVNVSLAALELKATETNFGEKIDLCVMVPDEKIVEVYRYLKTQVGGRIELTLPNDIND